MISAIDCLGKSGRAAAGCRPIRRRLLGGLAAAALALVLPAGPAAAERRVVDAEYRIFFAGIPLAKANLELVMQSGAYDARVEMAPTGIGTIVSASRTSVSAGGRVRSGKVEPASYRVRSKDSHQEVSVRMDLDRGNVSAVTALPPLRPSRDRVPVMTAHLKGIVDPLSSGLMPWPAERPLDARACDRTLPIFDGWTRYDVRLSHRRTETVSIGDYNGPAVVCGARWIPVSGHRPSREAVKYLQANTGLEVTLVPIADAGVLIPASVSIETRNGHLSVKSTSLSISRTRLAAGPAN